MRSNSKTGSFKDDRAMELVMATSLIRQREAKAGKVHREYLAHPSAQRLMTFSEFRNPSARNKVLAEFGHEPLTLPWEAIGKTSRSKRKRRSKAAGRAAKAAR